MKYFYKIFIVFGLYLFSCSNQAEAQAIPTMQDFWDKKAYFQFVNRSRFPTLQKQLDGTTLTRWGMEGMNGGNDLVIKDGIWYLFHREFYYETRPIGDNCNFTSSTIDNIKTDVARAVVRVSTDKGKSWSAGTVILEPTGNLWDMCHSGLDGDAFYDNATNTWHYIYQCGETNKAGNQQQGLCHATKTGASPLGLFTKDANPPAVSSGQIWKTICTDPSKKCNQISGGNNVYDEGTPEFIEKDSSGYFYVSFHGYSNAKYGYRGVAKTKDFKNWQAVAPDSINDKYSCQAWNGGYDSEGCVGGGAATILKDNNYYYQLVENPDKNLACQCGQQWHFGLLRSSSLSNSNWEQFSANPIVYSSKQHHKIADDGYYCGINQSYWCNIQYQRLFKDTDGQIYLFFLKVRDISIGFDEKVTGSYLYKLTFDSPLVDYNFREGDYYDHSESDIVSRYNPELKVNNVVWKELRSEKGTTKYNLVFNGNNSTLSSLTKDSFTYKDNFSVSIKVKVDSIPSTNSAYIAGVKSSYWMEVYPDGQLCAWVYSYNGDASKPGVNVNNCLSIRNKLGTFHEYVMTVKNGIFNLYSDSVLVGNKTLPNPYVWEQSGNSFQLGSSYPPSQNIYGCFTGEIESVKIYDKAIIPIPVTLDGDINNDGMVNYQDLLKVLNEWGTYNISHLLLVLNNWGK